MRTGYEKGFNVITLTDCTAATSPEGQAKAAGPDGTYGMFSTPMCAADFKGKLAETNPYERFPVDPVDPSEEAKAGEEVGSDDPSFKQLAVLEDPTLKARVAPVPKYCPRLKPSFGPESFVPRGPTVRFLRASNPEDSVVIDGLGEAIAPGMELATPVVGCKPVGFKFGKPTRVIIPVKHGANPVKQMLYKSNDTAPWQPIAFGQTADNKTATVTLKELGYLAAVKSVEKGSVFDVLEDTDRALCLDKCAELAERNRAPEEEGPDKEGNLDKKEPEGSDPLWKPHYFVLEGHNLKFTVHGYRGAAARRLCGAPRCDGRFYLGALLWR
jgi:hypothetical protein